MLFSLRAGVLTTLLEAGNCRATQSVTAMVEVLLHLFYLTTYVCAYLSKYYEVAQEIKDFP